MLHFFATLHPVGQAALATLFTWAVTALGAASVFLCSGINRKILETSLGFAAGVMIAASFWSLLAPAIALSGEMGYLPWVPPLAGFLLGSAALFGMDRLVPHLHLFAPSSEVEGIPTRWNRNILLTLAITLHNIPEGLAVGVAFGAVAAGIEGATLPGAVALAIGIGLQNFPEGAAVSLPLRSNGLSRWRSFMIGQSSALVEPVAGILGAAVVLLMRPLLPFALAFAAGAMIFVVVEEVIPESQSGHNTDLATLAALAGFAVMMTLDVALG
ncbi:MAG: ZIP family metal transporter [Candidatus Peribacter sp.]|nr:ZIP family metal transporter [Candidatus Peribacter sp.]